MVCDITRALLRRWGAAHSSSVVSTCCSYRGLSAAPARRANGPLLQPRSSATLAAQQAQQPPVASRPAPSQLTVTWPGRATLFWHQLGVLQHLQEAYPHIHKVPMLGFSGGSFVAAFAACNVDPALALASAHRLCEQRGAYSRPLGLLGIWGGIIRDWLEELLPEDAAQRCSGVGHIVVTQLPSLQCATISSFASRAALIDTCLASAHIPLLLDGQPAARIPAAAEQPHALFIDGGLRYYLTDSLEDYRLGEGEGPSLIFDPRDDQVTAARFSALASVLQTPSLAEVRELVHCGYQHSQRMQRRGMYGALGAEGHRQLKDMSLGGRSGSGGTESLLGS